MHPLSAGLKEGLDGLGLHLPEAQQAQLLAYMDLIAKWTKVYNLTAVRDAHEMLTHHLLDSLAVIAPLRRELAALKRPDAAAAEPASAGNLQTTFNLLDVGAGAGLPGVVIAIVCPEVSVTCVDTVAKKAAFIQQVAATLRLPNLKGLHARVESLSQPCDVVCSRAFASLVDFTAWSKSALAPHGVWMAMKGKHPHEELALLPKDAHVFHVEQLQVPGLNAERCIVWMRG
jgi:16S rRNA (guanine527-N7)-methyltransferase